MFSKLEFNERFKKVDCNLHSMAKILSSEFSKHRDVKLAYLQLKWFKSISLYSMYDREFSNLMFENLLLFEFYEEALIELNSLLKSSYIDFSKLINYLIKLSRLLKRNDVNSVHVNYLSFQNKTVLTKFGQENIEQVLKVLDIIIQTKFELNFFSDFFIFNDKGYKIATYPIEHYHKYYQIGKDSERKLKSEVDKIYKRKDGTAIERSVENAIYQHCSNLMREAENMYRISINGKKVGEGFIRETELYYKIKSYFSDFEVKQHGRPNFLGRQHFDVWIPEFKIAIEYHGEQHDRPIDFFGGEEAFIKNQGRDEEKRKKCIENDIVLIELRLGYDFDSLIHEIKTICNNRNIKYVK